MRYKLIDEPYNTIIRDTIANLNFLFVAESGHGMNTKTYNLAKKVVDFLNSLPEEDTKLM